MGNIASHNKAHAQMSSFKCRRLPAILANNRKVASARVQLTVSLYVPRMINAHSN